MLKIIKTLFGLSRAATEHAHEGNTSDPHLHWLASQLALVRRCDSASGLAVYLGNGNGYLREAAIARAIALACPELLPDLTARLNDWVPQVRRAAKNALLTLVPFMPSPDLLAVLPAVHQLLLARREDHAAWVRSFEEALLTHTGQELVIEGMRNKTVHVARACFRVAHTHQLIPAATLVRYALDSRDIRLESAGVAMLEGLPGPGSHELYLQALASPFGSVRTVALRALLAFPSDDQDALARTGLLDQQSSVRCVASGFLKQRGVDPDALYLERLHSPQASADEKRICLLALAAGGNVEHAALMEAYAASPVPRVRMAALMGWVRLAPSRKDDIAVLALQSPVARIRKLSLTLIRDFGAYVPLASAIGMAESQQDYPLMLRLARQEPWTWIETIVRLARSPEAATAMKSALIGDLHVWRHRSGRIYAAPEPRQVDLLDDPVTRSALQALHPSTGSLFSHLDYTLGKH